jgi:hypothetical protein
MARATLDVAVRLAIRSGAPVQETGEGKDAAWAAAQIRQIAGADLSPWSADAWWEARNCENSHESSACANVDTSKMAMHRTLPHAKALRWIDDRKLPPHHEDEYLGYRIRAFRVESVNILSAAHYRRNIVDLS